MSKPHQILPWRHFWWSQFFSSSKLRFILRLTTWKHKELDLHLAALCILAAIVKNVMSLRVLLSDPGSMSPNNIAAGGKGNLPRNTSCSLKKTYSPGKFLLQM